MQSSVSPRSGGGDVRGGGRGGWGGGCFYVNFLRMVSWFFSRVIPRPETRCWIFEICEIPKMRLECGKVCARMIKYVCFCFLRVPCVFSSLNIIRHDGPNLGRLLFFVILCQG